MKLDLQLVRAWRRLNAIGASVVALRFDRQAHLASALIEAEDGSRATGCGYTIADALDRCRINLTRRGRPLPAAAIFEHDRRREKRAS